MDYSDVVGKRRQYQTNRDPLNPQYAFQNENG